MPLFFRRSSLPYICSLKSIVLAFFLCFVSNHAWPQSDTYTNYQFEQGFKASNGYCLYQDIKGYIWIGTENGLMRFNGYDFKVYTTHDGLPDNEILSIAEDGNGRLWLGPYANSLCYIKNGKVFNSDNDPLLKSIHLDSRPETILIDRYNTVWIKNDGKLTGIRTDNTFIFFAGIEKKIYSYWIDDERKLMAVDAGGNIFQWDNIQFISKGKAPSVPSYHVWVNNSIWLDIDKQELYRHKAGESVEQFSNYTYFNTIHNYLNIQQFFPSSVHITSDNGVYEIDINTGKLKDSFLTGCKVGTMLQARDHSLWVGTIGQGVFRISKTPVNSVKFPGIAPSVLYIKGSSKGIYGTTGDARLFEADIMEEKVVEQVRFTTLDRYNPFNPYIFVLPYGYKKWLAFSSYIMLKPRDLKFWTFEMGIHCKSVIRENANQLLIASAIGVLRYDITRLRLSDTFLYKQKTMAIAKISNTIYAGMLDGLIAIDDQKRTYPVLPGLSLLRKHITALCPGKNNMLWCANNNTELIGLRNDSLMVLINIKNGLKCNRISCLRATGDFVWIGTDNGLYAIKQRPPYNIVRHITFASGLNSNQVNDLDVYGNRIWVGTLKGVNYFDEGDIFQERDSTKIIISSILNGDSLLTFSKDRIMLKDKPLTIDFDVIDFSGGTKTFFEYRIGNGPWTILESKSLYFSTIPYGAFTVSIRSFSPNWLGSTTFQQVFYNPLPFYRTWWFIVISCIVVIALLLLSAFEFIRKARKRDRKRLSIQKNLLLLEQTALQGQMNPHFIFNCIAAIKQYYSSGDITRANNFVHSFSSLIRQTFEMGTETFLSLDKELNYLVQYLSVEKERFNGTFDFRLDKQTQLPDSKIYIPTLLLQPIVENAIRHGIRHLSKGSGMINISVLQQKEMIEFTITDNGIGRKSSKALRERAFYSSMTSTTINEKRIHILNQLFNGKISMQITDLTGDDGVGCGTKVSISFPVDLKQFLKDESNNS